MAASQSSENTAAQTLAKRNPARQARLARHRRSRKLRIRTEAMDRLESIIPDQFKEGRTKKTLASLAKIAMRYIHATTGDPDSAGQRYLNHIASWRKHSSKWCMNALRGLIPVDLRTSTARHDKILICTTGYIESLQRAQQGVGDVVKIKAGEELSEEDGEESESDREERSEEGEAESGPDSGEDSDEVVCLGSYAKSKRTLLPQRNARTELAFRLMPEIVPAITVEEKEFISEWFGKANGGSFTDVYHIIHQANPEILNTFLGGQGPNLNILPDYVLVEILEYAKTQGSIQPDMKGEDAEGDMVGECFSPRMKGKSTRQKNMYDDDEAAGPSSYSRSARRSRKEHKTQAMIIFGLHREIKALHAALRMHGSYQDDIDEFTAMIEAGGTTQDALVGMGWKAVRTA